MKASLCCGVVFLMALAGCGGKGSGSNSGPGSGSGSPTISSVQVTPTTMSIGMGAKQQFTATAHLSDGSTQDITATAQWSSSDSNVASVTAAGVATGSNLGSVTITATSDTLKGSATLKIASAGDLVSLSLSPAASSVPVNTTVQFTATGTYADGTSADITKFVSWKSSTISLATINASGLATGVSVGVTKISASLSGVSQSTTLTVTAPTIASIAVTPVGLTLGIGINQQFTATATYSDGSSSDLAAGVTWASSSPAVATIVNSGLATTVGAGTTTITATVGSFSDTSTLTVVPAHLISISVAPAIQSIAVGTTQQFSAVGNFDDGSTQLLTSLTWSSSFPNVASIDSTGFASSAAAGTTTITAASGSVNGTAALTVTGASLVSIAVTPANSTMAVGTTKQFTATGSFSDSTSQDISASVLWTSSNAAAATINAQGLASSVATGSTTIKAALGSVSGTTALTVSTAHLTAITVSPANPRIEKGTSIKFTATGTFSDGSTASNLVGISWKSSKPNLASIRSSGIAHGKKGGTVTISASSSGVKGSTTLTVGTGTLVSLAITPAAPTVGVGTTQQFVATGTFSDASTQDVTLNSHWSSSSASVATVANAPSIAGLADCKGVGTSSIGANSGGVTGSAVLTVQ
jgi:uncharacterized protein YjdB